jgi:hypothetical protein
MGLRQINFISTKEIFGESIWNPALMGMPHLISSLYVLPLEHIIWLIRDHFRIVHILSFKHRWLASLLVLMLHFSFLIHILIYPYLLCKVTIKWTCVSILSSISCEVHSLVWIRKFGSASSLILIERPRRCAFTIRNSLLLLVSLS